MQVGGIDTIAMEVVVEHCFFLVTATTLAIAIESLSHQGGVSGTANYHIAPNFCGTIFS